MRFTAYRVLTCQRSAASVVGCQDTKISMALDFAFFTSQPREIYVDKQHSRNRGKSVIIRIYFKHNGWLTSLAKAPLKMFFRRSHPKRSSFDVRRFREHVFRGSNSLIPIAKIVVKRIGFVFVVTIQCYASAKFHNPTNF